MSAERETCALTFEVPTPRDYRNGGFGDLVAQCSCGAFDYVFSRREGDYWHGLHRSLPAAHPHFLLVNSPMPTDWEEVVAPTAVAPTQHVGPRVYICPACSGVGTTSAFGTQGGRFYHFGERARCIDCGGSGSTHKWAA